MRPNVTKQTMNTLAAIFCRLVKIQAYCARGAETIGRTPVLSDALLSRLALAFSQFVVAVWGQSVESLDTAARRRPFDLNPVELGGAQSKDFARIVGRKIGAARGLLTGSTNTARRPANHSAGRSAASLPGHEFNADPTIAGGLIPRHNRRLTIVADDKVEVAVVV